LFLFNSLPNDPPVLAPCAGLNVTGGSRSRCIDDNSAALWPARTLWSRRSNCQIDMQQGRWKVAKNTGN
jgi:hypothetical protein